ncbi:MAG: MarR family transcriptional regulator, partial [Bacteroidaceae bacterium]|nr:MarR family transcriptional regulator [Bacteroidaceae bacterium]
MTKTEIRQIRQIYRAIVAMEQEINTQYGLNLNEAVLLCHLNDTEGMTSGEIAEMMELSCSNTSKVIASVEKRGYVHRRIGKEDKRNMQVALTAKGKEMLENMNGCSIPVPEILY